MKKITSRLRIVMLFILIPLIAIAQEPKVRNVIIMIGDGMGLNQLYAAMSKQASPLNIEQCPVVGLSLTYSANNFTTDSGAGGTAIACGVKTKNGMIGMTADSIPVNSIMKIADDKGLATGVVATCNVTNATPASFIAHQVSRYKTQEIAVDYLTSGVDVFIGGGINDFEKRKDGRNLSKELMEQGYQVRYSMPEIMDVKTGKLAGLMYNDNPPSFKERGNMLCESTAKALELLNQNKKGFLLMIEGSQIDWQAHNNNFNEMIDEVLDFDKAVGLVLDFAKKDGNTLVIITADHETGGLSLLEKDKQTGEVKGVFAAKNHSGMPVPVYTFGPGAEFFTGMHENTYFYNEIKRLLHLEH